MKQISKNVNNKSTKRRKTTSGRKGWQKKTHPKFGTSKLEMDFATNFLDKLDVEYQWQFEAKDIGRFYDFYLPNQNLIIEIDGDYWHGNPEMYCEEKLRGHQRRAQKIDEYKDRWALLHGIPIIRIWESDIRKKPTEVMKFLKEKIHTENHNRMLIEEKNKRHNNLMKGVK